MSEVARKVAIVTGGARGIGAATVRRLTQDGWAVVSVDLDAVDPDFEPDPDTMRIVPGDATAEASWERWVGVAAELGRLTAVVNNAGAQGVGARLADVPLEDFRYCVGVNLESCFLGVRTGLRHLGHGGSIVNIASNAGSRGVPRFGSYVAAKHGVIGLTRTAALEGARTGIRVNAVAPGPTQTRIMDDVAKSFDPAHPEVAQQKMSSANPTRRFGRPAEIAAAISWLVGPSAGYVNGAVLAVDGGLTAG